MDIKEINYDSLKEAIDNHVHFKNTLGKSELEEVYISDAIINFLHDAGCIEKIKHTNSNMTWLNDQDYKKVEEVYKIYNCLYQKPDSKTYVHAIGMQERF